MEVITKQEAKAKGLRRYYTGVPCHKGHFSERNVSTGQCVQCLREYHIEKTRGGAAITRIHSVETAKLVVAPELHDKIILKADAIAQGLVRYFTGLPCQNGHIDERKVSSGDCLECVRERHHRKMKDPDYREHQRLSSKRGRQSSWYKKTLERDKKYRMLLRQVTHVTRLIKKSQTEWYENPDQAAIDRERKNQYAAERRRSVSVATPAWANIKDIRLLEREARQLSESTGVQQHCDHYYPIQSDVVCGLNVPWNIQIISAEENHAKSNRLPEEFYGPDHIPPAHFLPVVESHT